MAVKLESLRSNPQRENDGDWVALTEFTDPVTGEVPEVLVRGWNYTKFQAAFSKIKGIWAQRGFRTVNSVPGDIFQRDMGRIISEHILMNWRGFDEAYTKPLADDILRESPKLLIAVQTSSTQLADSQVEFVSDTSGNSARSSAGSSKAAA